MARSEYPLPLLIFLTMVISFSFIIGIFFDPAQSGIGMLLGGGGSLLCLVILHWRWGLWLENPDKRYVYTGVQSFLIIVVVFFTRSGSLWLGLSAWAFGEAAALVWPLKRFLVMAALYAVVATASLFLAVPGESLHLWLINGSVFIALISIVMLLFARERRARERAQDLAAELESANRQIASYAWKTADLTRAVERQWFARELHDTLAQGTAAIILQLEAAVEFLKQDKTGQGLSILRACMEQARLSLKETREAIDTLREGSGTEVNRMTFAHFADWLSVRCKVLAEETDTAYSLETSREDKILALSSEALLQSERILGEAWANAVRHGKARHISVELYRKGGELFLSLKDDGVGFSFESIPEGRYGIRRMRERAVLLGGVLELISSPAAGTRVLLSFPVKEEK